MTSKENYFTYNIQGGSVKGFFNIYQAKNGKLYLCMGSVHTSLTKEQIENDLKIDVYSLIDFDYDSYKIAYPAG